MDYIKYIQLSNCVLFTIACRFPVFRLMTPLIADILPQSKCHLSVSHSIVWSDIYGSNTLDVSGRNFIGR